MSPTAVTQSENSKPLTQTKLSKLHLVLIIAALIVTLSPWLDQFAEMQIDDTLLNSGIIYATARGINALVSVLQTVEVSMLFISVNIGEVLDPINDLIERFSDVASFALASLALQKILLLISAHAIFKALLLASAVLFLIGRFFQKPKFSHFTFKVFITLIFIRLAFAVVIIANSAVNSLFLQQQTEENYWQMQSYQQQLDHVAVLIKGQHNTTAQQQEIRQQLPILKKERQEVSAVLSSVEIQIQKQELQIRQRRDEIGTLSTFFSNDPQLEQLYQQLQPLQKQQKTLSDHITTLNDNIELAQETLLCLEQEADGKSCSFSDWMKTSSSAFNLKQKVLELSENIEAFINSTLILLTLLLLKSVLLPLIFWWMLYKVFLYVWSLRLPMPAPLKAENIAS